MFNAKLIATKIPKHDPAYIEKVVDELRRDPLLTEKDISKRDMCRLQDGQVYDLLGTLTHSSDEGTRVKSFKFLLAEIPFAMLHVDNLRDLGTVERALLMNRLREIPRTRLTEVQTKALVEAMLSLPETEIEEDSKIANDIRTVRAVKNEFTDEIRAVCLLLKLHFYAFKSDKEVRDDVTTMLALFQKYAKNTALRQMAARVLDVLLDEE